MSDKYRGKYRIASTRLQNWDYGWNAMYFVTICTQNRECYFGDVVDGVMQLSEIGEIVKQQWLKTFDIRIDMNLEMDEYVVMPNHFHAIIYIGKNKYNTGTDAMHCVSTNATTTTTTTTTNATNKFGPQSKNLSSIIRGFKSAVTINARKIHADFAWQSRYHDHIIRNDDSFQRIRNYICKNPEKWTNDKFYE